jgi:hypothetical protein
MKQKSTEKLSSAYLLKLFMLSAVTSIAAFGFLFVLQSLISPESSILPPDTNRVDFLPVLIVVFGLSVLFGGIVGIAAQFILFGQNPMQFNRHDITLFVLTLFVGINSAGLSLAWIASRSTSEFGFIQYPLIGVLSMYGVKYLVRWYDKKTGYKHKNEVISEQETSAI